MKPIFKKTIYIVVAVIVAGGIFSLGLWIGVTKIAYHVPQPGTLDFSLFWDAYNKLQQNFIDPVKIDDQTVLYGAIKGMTNALGDPYTDFFNPEQAKKFSEDLSGSFNGIGVEIGIKKDMLTIVAPLKGTPGQRAGLQSGDVIAKIDGKDSLSISIDEAVNLIRGTRGTIVTLTIMREGWDAIKDIKIVRDTIKIPDIDWSLKNEDTAYIQMYQFDETLSTDFQTVAREILQSPAKKIILDLRDNPGGYLEIAQNIAGWFLQAGKTVTIEDFGEGNQQQLYIAEGNGAFVDYPTVVLINQGSASASEILAGALRDNRAIKLIGNKSFGKGSVQQVIDLRGGSFLKITIAHWLTPNGNSISEVGLTPDVIVDITDQQYNSGQDPQLDKALEIISALK